MKSLQERLKALEAAGMITRTVYDEKIPRVSHTITDRGRRLFAIMSELKNLAEEIEPANCKCSLEGVCETEMHCLEARNSDNVHTAQRVCSGRTFDVPSDTTDAGCDWQRP